ncbi:sensor domain-containing diguanylate cyclase [Novosphingobium ginsenosidimutans]|uniref:GGDEF domain-containing protein n=1 Tax=Novosphingobium ginsenosidimutans TaxID=1176536 RepID=A0A5B8S1R6_9SPHN|nr:sensor domain-containing diguanylate cyclase [Novosphingobium ginsenosidimutans]QEA14637.1 GGDEF domain-containing protein [Novosphingobium ginsenosidimutans]QEA17391.1 GGDEF domain-containing protein [Novosphingobium ginsenosidimutans]
MGVHFVPRGDGVLLRLWAGVSSEIALACDRQGQITELCGALPGDPIGRPLWDLAVPRQRERLRQAYAAALAQDRRSDWIELALRGSNGAREWHELRIDPVTFGPDHSLGAICVLRSITERRRLEREAFAAAMTDPLTGFTNRTAFMAMLAHLAEQDVPGALALVDLDRFRVFNLRYGHAAGDRLLVSFAGLLRQVTRPDHILSRTDGETFAVIMPGADLSEARTTAGAITSALANVASGAQRGELPFTASIGLALLGPDNDASLRCAELAVTDAKARGRARIGLCPSRLRLPWTWRQTLREQATAA